MGNSNLVDGDGGARSGLEASDRSGGWGQGRWV